MTDKTIQLIPIEWDPEGEGIKLQLNNTEFGMNMISVRELRDDMEEASLLSRGYEKWEGPVEEVRDGDLISVLGHYLPVKNCLMASRKDAEEETWILQFDIGSFTNILTEIQLPGDMEVTAWRAIA